MRSSPLSSPLWVITSYFNPCGYSRRRTNYAEFRRRLAAPLLTVELSFDRTFELGESDADLLVRLDGGHVMWQKERLLNVALEHLPATCDSVAWIDCDILFENDEWIERTRRALERLAVVQLFDRAYDLPAGATGPAHAPGLVAKPSIAGRWAAGTVTPDDFSTKIARIDGSGLFGMAWAARRSLLGEHGLYDRRIVGGGDRALACAAMDRIDDAVGYAQMNEAQEAHYRAWAGPYRDSVARRVGCVPGAVYHLWHGDLEQRGYRERHSELRRFDFDPAEDLRLGSNGAWRWGSDKPELHRFVAGYFDSRNEDGEARPAGGGARRA